MSYRRVEAATVRELQIKVTGNINEIKQFCTLSKVTVPHMVHRDAMIPVTDCIHRIAMCHVRNCNFLKRRMIL